MAEIQFYHLTSTALERALPKLLDKALAGGFRALVVASSEQQAEYLSTSLWTYDPGSFLPHGTPKDGDAALHPVLITAGAENLNGANLLVVTDGSEPAPEGYARMLDIFDGNDAASVEGARGRWKKYQAAGHSVTYIRQNAGGGWAKQVQESDAA